MGNRTWEPRIRRSFGASLPVTRQLPSSPPPCWLRSPTTLCSSLTRPDVTPKTGLAFPRCSDRAWGAGLRDVELARVRWLSRTGCGARSERSLAEPVYLSDGFVPSPIGRGEAEAPDGPPHPMRESHKTRGGSISMSSASVRATLVRPGGGCGFSALLIARGGCRLLSLRGGPHERVEGAHPAHLRPARARPA
ncbi:uncharacterized protein STAUR_7711 [Stigmatella aurantiaca DW4/3-1]|uniref:Uncharacterized protein n=1 Tax=Stigmatella aurantiaca (strain DW4/3-1) TaxID=378806 RepID=E3FK97_STIAD|nr:uncharacterized protein STAUR_7711 [Stigmatella aurantiaca DW4/3-1]